jgi:hypothetical protein
VLFDQINGIAVKIKENPDVDESFEILERVCILFVKCVDVIVSQQEKAIVSIALKSGKKFIDTFNKLLSFLKKNFVLFSGLCLTLINRQDLQDIEVATKGHPAATIHV